MKKLLSFFSVLFFLLLSSCSNGTTSLTLTLKTGDARSAARDIEPDNKEEGSYIIAALNGDYREVQSKFVSLEEDECSFTFDSVPVGKKVYAELNIYSVDPMGKEEAGADLDGQYFHKIHDYNGRSQTITVAAGENYLPLDLYLLEGNPEEDKGFWCFNLYGEAQDGSMVYLELQSTGKYTVFEPDLNIFYSEGLWRSDESIDSETFYKRGSHSLYLTECVYGRLTTKNEMTGGQVRYTRPVIVEQPQEKVLEIKGGDDPYFKFTSKSGKTFVFGEESIDDPLPQTYSLDFDWDSSQGDYECPLENFLPAGEEVYFTVTPDSGYRIKSVTVKYSSGDDLNSELESDGSGYYRFTMPEQDVCVAIEFELIPPPNDFIYVQGGGTISPGNTAYSDSEVLVSGTYIPNFYMCEHEVTQAEYQEYCCYSGSSPNTLWADLNYPATYINWYSAIVYCNLRSMAENRTPVYSLNGETNPALWNDKTEGTGEYVGKYAGPSTNIDTWNNIEMDSSANGYRLPTEAEWEYAARGGMQADPYAYSGSDTPSEVAVYDVSDFAPSQVKSKNANSIGIYDMSGNVAEWTWDTSDGGTNRYFRGGSFSTTIEDFLKVNKRLYQPPYNGNSTQGFRVVLNAD